MEKGKSTWQLMVFDGSLYEMIQSGLLKIVIIEYKSIWNKLRYDLYNNMQQEKVAIVTGSSSVIGYETSVLLARNGFHTYAIVRNLDKSKSLIDIAKKWSFNWRNRTWCY